MKLHAENIRSCILRCLLGLCSDVAFVFWVSDLSVRIVVSCFQRNLLLYIAQNAPDLRVKVAYAARHAAGDVPFTVVPDS